MNSPKIKISIVNYFNTLPFRYGLKNSELISELIIKRETKGSVHFDGEPFIMDAELKYTLKPKSIKAIVGEVYDGI